jgi:hypothetical protein
MKFRNTRKAQLQAIIEESLLAAPKKSISLGRKTGSNILKGEICLCRSRPIHDDPLTSPLLYISM